MSFGRNDVSLDDLAFLLLAVLEGYPNINNQYLSILLSHPRTTRIATSLSEVKVRNLSVEDFENVGRSGEFLHNCGAFLSNYGTIHSDVNFLNLSVALYQKSREYFEIGTYMYALASINEGATRSMLAELRVNPIDNLKKAIELCERARHEGLVENTHEYALDLMDEGVARSLIARLGVNPVDNLIKAIECFENARYDGFKKNTSSYGRALMNEGVARSLLEGFGLNPIDSLKKAIIRFKEARNEGLVKNTQEYASTFMNEGVAWLKLGELGINPSDNIENAIKLCARARREGLVENTPNYGKTLMEEGFARLRLAEFGVSTAENLNKAFDLFESARNKGLIKDTQDYARTLMNQGIGRLILAPLFKGQIVNQEDNLENAIELFERARYEGFIKDTPEYGSTLREEGTARLELAKSGVNTIDNLKKAIEFCERARYEGLVKNTPDYYGTLMNEGTARLALAELEIEKISNLNKAESMYLEAMDFFSQRNDRKGLIAINNNLGILKDIGGETPKAYDYFKEAIQLIEETRGSIKIPELRKEYFETVVDTYKKMVFTCLALHKDKEAFRYAESVKGRTFLELLANEKKIIKGKSELTEQYKEVLRRIEEIEAKFMSGMEKAVKEQEELRYLKGLHDDLLKQIKQNDPEYYSIKTVEPIDLDELSKILNGRTLVEYFLGEKLAVFIFNGSLTVKIGEMYLFGWGDVPGNDNVRIIEFLKHKFNIDWIETAKIEKIDYGNAINIITEKNSLSLRLNDEKTKVKLKINDGRTYDLIAKTENNKINIYIETNENDMLKKVIEFRELIREFEIGIKYKAQSERAEEILKEIYKLLIEPIKQHLSKNKEIIIIPHSYLHQIPFQALKGEKYLIEDYKISFAQSASSLKFLKKGVGVGALIVGNPTKDLKHAEAEASEVAKLFINTNPILGDAATKERILKEIKNKEILHFACHGEFDPFNPAFSKVVLSDGSITAIDFMDLEMDANLTVLSACDTAKAEIARGDEVEGLVRAVQYGGCRFVIASLWRVDDKSTKELFVKFYSNKGDMVDRIKEAELSLKEEKYGFYHWAPFQIYGI
jgi:CHAT domain-containing protein/TPR repeat protein